jgi:hypothetical protein
MQTAVLSDGNAPPRERESRAACGMALAPRLPDARPTRRCVTARAITANRSIRSFAAILTRPVGGPRRGTRLQREQSNREAQNTIRRLTFCGS